MKLLYRIVFRVSLALLTLFALWGVLFYFIVIEEINDETDDSLEYYAENIITRALTGEKLPEKQNGTNNSYFISEVSPEYAEITPNVQFTDENVYIQAKKETEPARIYKTIFKDDKGQYYELTVMIPTIEKKDLKETILIWIVVLYVALLIAIITINVLILHRSLNPLYTILDWIKNLSVNKEATPLTIDTEIKEFNKLSEALLVSAKRNAEIYEQQSLFIGHASHELQTPIAIALNRLEVLTNDPTLNEEQLTQVLKAKNALVNISKLNKTLLLLARIENKQFPDSKEVNVNTFLKKLSEDFIEIYQHKKIVFTLREESVCVLTMNETLASVLFSNLIKNAYIHNKQNGEIIISIESDRILFSNTAISEALDPKCIFQRFYLGDKKEGSVGLGLSLVQSIVELYEMKVEYTFHSQMHHFLLWFCNK